MAVFLWSHPTKRFLDVYISPQNYMNTKDGVENQQILNIVASLGALHTLRLACSTISFIPCTDTGQSCFIWKDEMSQTHTDLC